MITSDALKPRFEVSRSQEYLCLVEKRGDQCVDEAIGQFEGVRLVDDEGENYIAIDFEVDAEIGIVYLFEWSLLSLGVRGDFGMMMLDFLPDLKQLLIGVRV